MTVKLGFTTMATPRMDHRGAIALARANEINAIDIRCSDHLGEITLEDTDEQIRQVADDFDSAGMIISSLMCYNDVPDGSAGAWDKFRQSLDLHLAIAAKLRTRAIRIFGGQPENPRELADFTARSAEIIQAALDAAPSAVNIVLQNHSGSYNAREGAKLAETVDRPRFGLVFSPDHCVGMKEDRFAEVLDRVRPWTKQVYISDIHIEGDKHPSVIPGQGDVPLAETISYFRANDFDGYFSFKWEKIWQDSLAEPQIALPEFVKFMKATIAD